MVFGQGEKWLIKEKSDKLSYCRLKYLKKKIFIQETKIYFLNLNKAYSIENKKITKFVEKKYIQAYYFNCTINIFICQSLKIFTFRVKLGY